MSSTIESLLNGKTGKHIFPILSLHGEDEETIRSYIGIIDRANCKGLVLDGRRHPDFCGPNWWQDLDVVLEEAQKRKMRVWISDGLRCPGGAANTALRSAEPKLHRQALVATMLEYKGHARRIILDLWKDFPPHPKSFGLFMKTAMKTVLGTQTFDDDEILAVYAVNGEGQLQRYPVPEKGEDFIFDKPDGDWTLYAVGTTRNLSLEKDYLNLADTDSVKLLIDTVYEPHYKRYPKEFGKSIAGFFSDHRTLTGAFGFDPEMLGQKFAAFPVSDELKSELQTRFGTNWLQKLYLLWDETDTHKEAAANVRFQYMDALTSLVRDHFSYQISTWCFGHNVEYIGCSEELRAAHAFRTFEGYDMGSATGSLDSAVEAVSAGALEPHKSGNSMTVLFGDLGPQEGLRLEKELADRFLVRGINHFIPRAFSPRPSSEGRHLFYAGGNDPQFGHLPALFSYMNRCADLITGGRHVASAAVLYDVENRWAEIGKAGSGADIVNLLSDSSICADLVPSDVFANPDFYHTELEEGLTIHTQSYRVLLIPPCDALPRAVAEAVGALTGTGFPVWFIGSKPTRILGESSTYETERLLQLLEGAEIVALSDITKKMLDQGLADVIVSVAQNSRARSLRVFHYLGSPSLYLFSNESKLPWSGTVTVSDTTDCFLYDAWRNEASEAAVSYTDCGMSLPLSLNPEESIFLILEGLDERLFAKPFEPAKDPLAPSDWVRTILTPQAASKAITTPQPASAGSIASAGLAASKAVTFPDTLAEEIPDFSGIVRYETTFTMEINEPVTLEITDAEESVEVFLNGQSLGIGFRPPFCYNLQPKLREGVNELRIDVATTMEQSDNARKTWKSLFAKKEKPEKGCGITGEVILRRG